jgi:hypothetical protein
VPPKPQTQDPDRPLSERERELIRRLLRWEELPAGFKAALTDYVSVNGSLHVSSMPTLKGEEWREVTTFTNSWVNHTAVTQESAAFYRDALGIVHLKGLIKSGTITASAFTLPEGYRPPLTKRFACPSAGAFGQCDVGADGTVTPAVGNNANFDLSGVQFRAA